MRKLVLSIFAVGATLAAAGPAAAEQKASAPAASHHSDNLASMLSLRLRSIELQIDILSDRVIGREEAQDLRAEARRLEHRLYRSGEREAAALEPEVERLQQHLRAAADDARLGALTSRRRDLGRFDDGDRYTQDRERYYDHDAYQRADPRGDPFAIWEERDEREPH
jgi:hypothetical protein